jgi:hypothetical protein
MKDLREIIKETLLLEIAEVIGKIRLNYDGEPYVFNIKTTYHSNLRGKGRDDIEFYDEREITKEELLEFLKSHIKDILISIKKDEIISNIPFVMRSKKWSLSLAIGPNNKRGNIWDFVIYTVFREGYNQKFKTGKYQFILDV